MKLFLKILLLGIGALAVVFIATVLFLARPVPQAEQITWGIDFSQMQAEVLKLNWKKTYLAMLEDLEVSHIKLHTQWDWIEGKQNQFYFQDTDWQLAQAANHGADVIYVVGMKTGRWPECHIPAWANSLAKDEQQKALLTYVETVVNRYKNDTTIIAWQAENEPLFKFGQCPWYDKQFLAKEVALIKALDPSRPVIVSETGEQSLWWQVSGIGDIAGTTLYRTAWIHLTNQLGFYIHFPLPPSAYYWRAKMVHFLFGKKVINIELQAEPWVNGAFYEVSLEEQEKTMNVLQFKENIEYAKNTGFDTFYLWGVEWWYWLKEVHEKPEIWNEAKTLFTH